MMGDSPHAQTKGQQQYAEQRQSPMLETARQQCQQQREDDVKLLLHRQRPGVQQGLEIGGDIEIAVLAHEQDVGDEHHLVTHRSPQFFVILRCQQKPADRQHRNDHREQRRQNPPRTPGPEIDEAELPGLALIPDDRRDQVTGNHEKHVHADKAAGKPRNAKVKQHDGDHRHCAQAVDIPSISQ
ncbi:hypothetical protein D3C78_931240 [compost metagenome]